MQIHESYKLKEKEITSRLNQFKSLQEKDRLNEFMFCLLTPQSNAQRCWQAVEEISKLKKLEETKVIEILKTRTRFHNTKAKRILSAKDMYSSISPLLSNLDVLQLRNQIAEKVNGYGLKEASHFLRNIGLSNNKIAILDRHILRNLKARGVISSDKIKSEKQYLELEQSYLQFAGSLNIPADALDLFFWSQENGEIFK
jgi:N-glycosylase/DNA lyase